MILLAYHTDFNPRYREVATNTTNPTSGGPDDFNPRYREVATAETVDATAVDPISIHATAR